MTLKKGVLGNTIRTHRMLLGLSQEKLAEMVDITSTHLKHLESEHRKPSIEVLFRLVKVLHISLDELLLTENYEDSDIYKNLLMLLSHCTKNELEITTDVVRSLIQHQNQ